MLVVRVLLAHAGEAVARAKDRTIVPLRQGGQEDGARGRSVGSLIPVLVPVLSCTAEPAGLLPHTHPPSYHDMGEGCGPPSATTF